MACCSPSLTRVSFVFLLSFKGASDLMLTLIKKNLPVDDKVGTSLTATSVTGLPIYFVGVGQTYTDLKQLRVKHIVNALMRD